MLRTTFPSLHAWGYGISSRVKTGRVVATPDTQDPGAGGSLESISLRGAQAKHRKTLFQKKKKKTKKTSRSGFTNNPDDDDGGQARNALASSTGTASESAQENLSPPPPSQSLFLGREGKTIPQRPPSLAVGGYSICGGRGGYYVQL